MTTTEFAAAVLDAAHKVPAAGLYQGNPNQVFIAAVWDQLEGHHIRNTMTLDTFKHRLAVANCAGDIALIRCDIPEKAPSAAIVEWSSVRFMGVAEYHLLDLRPGA